MRRVRKGLAGDRVIGVANTLIHRPSLWSNTEAAAKTGTGLSMGRFGDFFVRELGRRQVWLFFLLATFCMCCR
jgi:hypothetical protein